MSDKKHLIHKRFVFPKGCSVKEMVIREIDGKDELQAARFASAKVGSADSLSAAVMDENLRVSVVSVDGKKVQQPYMGMDSWSTKTRRLLVEAWATLNSVEDEAVADFLSSSEVLVEESPEVQEISEEQVAKIQAVKEEI